MTKIVYVGTDKWSPQLAKISSSPKIKIVHAVIPNGSKRLKEIWKSN